jgi:hypothetical protein
VRGVTITIHLGAGNERAFVYAWNEPGWKIGKELKKPFLASAENCCWAAPDAAWRKERTNLLPDNTVERRYIDDT